jgi:hypothetical protein
MLRLLSPAGVQPSCLQPVLQGDQVPLLMQRLVQARLEAQHAQLESAALRCRLAEETELRCDLERELEDTAAAAQELWESMQVGGGRACCCLL